MKQEMFLIGSKHNIRITERRAKKKVGNSRHQLDDIGKPEIICLCRYIQDKEETKRLYAFSNEL
jgi:hypothetical protein